MISNLSGSIVFALFSSASISPCRNSNLSSYSRSDKNPTLHKRPIEAVQRRFWQYLVCVQHGHLVSKISKYSRGWKSLMCRDNAPKHWQVVPIAIGMVCREACTEGSEPANLVPTNRNWILRLLKSDEVAQHTDVQRLGNQHEL